MHILITGAANGIGKALTQVFIENLKSENVRLTLVDIDEDQLSTWETASVSVQCLVQDLSDVDKVDGLLEQATKSFGPVDVLINNAGIMDVKSMGSFEWDKAWKLLNVDLITPLKLIHSVLPSMKNRRSGSIINISSMAGVVPLRGCSFYGAAKAGLAMASECLNMESSHNGIHVLTVYPGPVRTKLERGARQGFGESWIYDLLPSGETDVIAQMIFDAWKKEEPRMIYPTAYRLGFILSGVARKLSNLLTPNPVS